MVWTILWVFCQCLFSAWLLIFLLGFGSPFVLLQRESAFCISPRYIPVLFFTWCLLVWRRWVCGGHSLMSWLSLSCRQVLSIWGCKATAFSSVLTPPPDVMLPPACISAPLPEVEFSLFFLFPYPKFCEFPPVLWHNCFAALPAQYLLP